MGIFAFDFRVPLFPFMDFTPWRLYMLCGNLFALIPLLGCMWVTESPRYLLATDNHQDAIEVLQHIYKINSGDSKLVS